MNQTMKKLFSKSGWLVMAAALLTGMASCSSDEDMVQSSEAKSGSSIDVCVKAGFDNDATRSTVVETTTGGVTTRDLQFTDGDRLYVYGHIGYKMIGTYPDLIGKDLYIVGFLNLYEIKDNPTFADFKGDLYVYERSDSKLIPSSYDFGDANPLAENANMTTTATLVHAAAVENVDYTIDENTKEITIIKNMAHDVNTLMTKNLWIRGNYTSSSSGFSLDIVDYQPIFECTITGAPAEELELTASYLSSQKLDGVEFGKRTTDFTFTKPAGATSFDLAFVGIPYTGEYHQIQVASEKYGTLVVSLGQTRDGEEAQPLPNTVIKVGNLPWLPDVTKNSDRTKISPTNNGKDYIFTENCNITIAGSSLDSKFDFQGTTNTVTLDNFTTFYNPQTACPISAYVYNDNTPKNINLILKGNNRIDCSQSEGMYQCISCYGELKLSGEGSLTVTNPNQYNGGIYANNYNGGNDVYVLAAPGYKVTRTGGQNDKGTYTWTYTVEPYPDFSIIRNSGPEYTQTTEDWVNIFYTFPESDQSCNFTVKGKADSQRIITNNANNSITIEDLYVDREWRATDFITATAASSDNTVLLTVKGINYYICTHSDGFNFINSNSPVKLTGNGKLIITTKDATNKGIIASNHGASVPLANLAASGTTVSRTETSNTDGTHTYVYTITTPTE
jgi:hypothetical protein